MPPLMPSSANWDTLTVILSEVVRRQTTDSWEGAEKHLFTFQTFSMMMLDNKDIVILNRSDQPNEEPAGPPDEVIRWVSLVMRRRIIRPMRKMQ